MEVDTYFCKTPRGIELSVLSPSLSFCYYFKTKEEHLEWLAWMSQICEKDYPNLIFEFMHATSKDRVEILSPSPCISELPLDPER
jgi:hypothetical protein